MIDYAEPKPGILTLQLLDHAGCHTIITRCNEHDRWRPAGIVDRTRQGKAGVKPMLRSALLCSFDEGTDVWHLLHKKVDGLVRPLVRSRWHRDFPTHSEIQVVRYPPGGFYHTHRDSGPYLANRYFSIVWYLNDDFEAGGTYFPDGQFTVVPEQGKAVIFPSDYRHQALRVESGTKYIAVTWLLGPPPIRWI